MPRRNLVLFVAGGLLVTLGLAFFLSPLASSSPDGLNSVARQHGFSDTERDHPFADGRLAGYGVRGVEDEGLGKGLSGAIGVVVTFGIGLILFGALRAVRARRDPAPSPPG